MANKNMNEPLLVVIPFYRGDLDLAIGLSEWIAELGQVSDFQCLLTTVEKTDYARVQRACASAFKSVEVLQIGEPQVPQGWQPWPVCPNVMFERSAWRASQIGSPFLFLEPDTCPTRPSWLKELNASYHSHGCKYMGAWRETWLVNPDGSRYQSEYHMVGMGIYPKDFYQNSDLVRGLGTRNAPFDYQLQGEVARSKSMVDSPLFSHHWQTYGWHVEDGQLRAEQKNPNAICDTLDLRTPAIVHGCKDNSLLHLLRLERQKDMAGRAVIQAPPGWNPNPEYERMRGQNDNPIMNPAAFHSQGEPSAQTPGALAKMYQEGLEKFAAIKEAGLPEKMAQDAVDSVANQLIEAQQSGALDTIKEETDAEYDAGKALDTVDGTDAPKIKEKPSTKPIKIALSLDEAEEKHGDSIRADKAGGMGWKELLKKYKVPPAHMKQILAGTPAFA